MVRLQGNGALMENSGSDRSRGRLTSLRRAWRHRRVPGDAGALPGDSAERLVGWVSVKAAEGIRKTMKIIIKGFEVLDGRRVEVFPFDIWFLYAVRNEVIYKWSFPLSLWVWKKAENVWGRHVAGEPALQDLSVQLKQRTRNLQCYNLSNCLGFSSKRMGWR